MLISVTAPVTSVTVSVKRGMNHGVVKGRIENPAFTLTIKGRLYTRKRGVPNAVGRRFHLFKRASGTLVVQIGHGSRQTDARKRHTHAHDRVGRHVKRSCAIAHGECRAAVLRLSLTGRRYPRLHGT